MLGDMQVDSWKRGKKVLEALMEELALRGIEESHGV